MEDVFATLKDFFQQILNLIDYLMQAIKGLVDNTKE